MPHAIGILELSSIAAGFQTQDALVKAAAVDVFIARTICSGKYLIVIGGSVASVQAALEVGERITAGFTIQNLCIPNIDPQIFPALSGTVTLPEDHPGALGVLETFSAVSAIEAADAAVKSAHVTLYRVHVAMAIGGKAFFLVNGDIGNVSAAIESAVERIKSSGMVTNFVVMPAASEELFREYI